MRGRNGQQFVCCPSPRPSPRERGEGIFSQVKEPTDAIAPHPTSRNRPPPPRGTLGSGGVRYGSRIGRRSGHRLRRPPHRRFSLGAAPARGRGPSLGHRARPQRATAARLHHARRPLASAGRGQGCRPRYLAMLLAFEDKRFWRHGGVDFVAIARAAAANAASPPHRLRRLDADHAGGAPARGRARAHRRRQAAPDRARAAARAQLTKDEILRLYLRLAPFGGNIEGVRAASLAYFGKEPRRLSLAEAALLVALPQSPEAAPAGSPYSRQRAAPATACLATAVAARRDPAAEAARAKRRRVPRVRREFPKLAPHLAEAEVEREPSKTVHRLTIDRELQASLEQLASEHTRALGQKLVRRRARRRPHHRRGDRPRRLGRLSRRQPTSAPSTW